MKKNSVEELKFSTLKIKRIIQENKEIGKIANMTPYVICNFFLMKILNSKGEILSNVIVFFLFFAFIYNANYSQEFLSNLF